MPDANLRLPAYLQRFFSVAASFDRDRDRDFLFLLFIIPFMKVWKLSRFGFYCKPRYFYITKKSECGRRVLAGDMTNGLATKKESDPSGFPNHHNQRS